jgi:hypothetical protein
MLPASSKKLDPRISLARKIRNPSWELKSLLFANEPFAKIKSLQVFKSSAM